MGRPRKSIAIHAVSEFFGVRIFSSLSLGIMSWESKPFRYGNTCDSCGATIEKREVGWHEPVAQKARCTSCGPSPVATLPSDEKTQSRDVDPVGGSAALREARVRRDPKWTKGPNDILIGNGPTNLEYQNRKGKVGCSLHPSRVHNSASSRTVRELIDQRFTNRRDPIRDRSNVMNSNGLTKRIAFVEG